MVFFLTNDDYDSSYAPLSGNIPKAAFFFFYNLQQKQILQFVRLAIVLPFHAIYIVKRYYFSQQIKFNR